MSIRPYPGSLSTECLPDWGLVTNDSTILSVPSLLPTSNSNVSTPTFKQEHLSYFVQLAVYMFVHRLRSRLLSYMYCWKIRAVGQWQVLPWSLWRQGSTQLQQAENTIYIRWTETICEWNLWKHDRRRITPVSEGSWSCLFHEDMIYSHKHREASFYTSTERVKFDAPCPYLFTHSTRSDAELQPM